MWLGNDRRRSGGLREQLQINLRLLGDRCVTSMDVVALSSNQVDEPDMAAPGG